MGHVVRSGKLAVATHFTESIHVVRLERHTITVILGFM